MRNRIAFRIRNFSKRWRYWILQFIGWLLSLIRDYYATQIIFGGTVSDVIGWFPQGLSGLALLVLVLSIVIILIYDFIDTRKQPDLKQIKLANQCQLSYPDDDHLSKENYSFTWINESGSNLKNCFVLLDGLYKRKSSTGKWELVFQDTVANSAIWNKPSKKSGKIDISNNDRAAFTLISMNKFNGFDAAEGKIDYRYDFRFSLLDNDSIGLYNGWEHRILLGLRATDENKTDFIVRYYIYLRVDGKPEGVTIKGMNRLTEPAHPTST